MNFPGILYGDAGCLAKVKAAHDRDKPVDGHAPGVLGKSLNAYAAARIYSDHEAFTIEEGRERLRAGMWLLIREASAARNLRALLPLVQEYGPHRCAFCTDDREPDFLYREGHINQMCRVAVEAGIAAEDALLMATLHGARATVDKQVRHSGKASVRFEDFAHSPGGTMYLAQTLQVQPYRSYRIRCWVKTEDVAPREVFYMWAIARDGRDLAYLEPWMKPTSDWHELVWAFNSWNSNQIDFRIGVSDGLNRSHTRQAISRP